MWISLSLLMAAALPVSGAPLRPMSSAEVCGGCHRSIVDAWKESAHAKAMESRLFQDALDAAETAMGSGVRKTCMGCHAPLAAYTGDLDLQKKVSWEGVTCEYCHSVRDVTIDNGKPQVKIEFNLVKSGPLKQTVSGTHSTAYSEVHESSRVCAPCHEFRNAQGYAVLSTYTEWQKSRYAKEGKNCQSCHMYQVAGRVADVKLARSPDSHLNLHRMPGGHSLDQLNRTVKAKLSTVREGGKAKVTVEVSNTNAGHYVPTGSPLRKIVLTVRAETRNGQRLEQQRVYGRVVADGAGKALQLEHAAFLQAASTVSDTRLAPDEVRKEEFTFDVPEGQSADIRATLSYYYSPAAREDAEQRTNFLSLRGAVR